jgi:hypothetical protein
MHFYRSCITLTEVGFSEKSGIATNISTELLKVIDISSRVNTRSATLFLDKFAYSSIPLFRAIIDKQLSADEQRNSSNTSSNCIPPYLCRGSFVTSLLPPAQKIIVLCAGVSFALVCIFVTSGTLVHMRPWAHAKWGILFYSACVRVFVCLHFRVCVVVFLCVCVCVCV